MNLSELSDKQLDLEIKLMQHQIAAMESNDPATALDMTHAALDVH